ncbi:MAG: arsenite methyltransferase [Actinomycetota bacterium]|nr:arsenite methyltransferase [Actinomycetota bacterium]
MSDAREEVRKRYADAATAVSSGSMDAAALETSDCCGSDTWASCCGETTAVFGPELYSRTETTELPTEAVLASLGCGNPLAVAELREGETVLDLGSGGGIDVLLSAKRVGPAGKAYGLDMTDEMLELANRNKAQAGAENVEFLKGYIEDIPLPDGSVDVVISNCVINLSSHKSAVFAEMYRVLKPGGRIGITDVVASNTLTEADRAERGTFAGCIAGALSLAEYQHGLAAAGFSGVDISITHDVVDGMHSAIVRAQKPAS